MYTWTHTYNYIYTVLYVCVYIYTHTVLCVCVCVYIYFPPPASSCFQHWMAEVTLLFKDILASTPNWSFLLPFGKYAASNPYGLREWTLEKWHCVGKTSRFSVKLRNLRLCRVSNLIATQPTDCTWPSAWDPCPACPITHQAGLLRRNASPPAPPDTSVRLPSTEETDLENLTSSFFFSPKFGKLHYM